MLKVTLFLLQFSVIARAPTVKMNTDGYFFPIGMTSPRKVKSFLPSFLLLLFQSNHFSLRWRWWKKGTTATKNPLIVKWDSLIWSITSSTMVFAVQHSSHDINCMSVVSFIMLWSISLSVFTWEILKLIYFFFLLFMCAWVKLCMYVYIHKYIIERTYSVDVERWTKQTRFLWN